MILAIDPGTRQSGYVVFADRAVQQSGVEDNERILQIVQSYRFEASDLAIERFEAMGMPLSDDGVWTMLWTGRFWQAWGRSVLFVTRRAVKLELCGVSRAKDANVRQALLDRVGPQGTKKAPGPTYGVASHAWSALGVAVCAAAGIREIR